MDGTQACQIASDAYMLHTTWQGHKSDSIFTIYFYIFGYFVFVGIVMGTIG